MSTPPVPPDHPQTDAPAAASRRLAGKIAAGAGHAAPAVLVAAILAGAIWWIVERPAPAGIEIVLPTPTAPVPVVVHVIGAVARPGLYALEPGARLNDAIAAAGGPLDSADTDRVNLASFARDGQQIVVPTKTRAREAKSSSGGQTPQSAAPRATREDIAAVGERQAPPEAGAASPRPRLDVNTASAEELETLPKIGAVKAETIIAWRDQHGPFKTLDDLLDVSGIGPATLEAIRPYLLAP